MRSIPALLALLALPLIAVGCTSTKPPVAKDDPVPVSAYPQVEAIGEANRYVLVAEPVINGGGNVPLSVSVPIRTTTTKDLNVQYKFVFFDAAGNALQPEMTWMPKRLLSRSQAQVSATAIDTTAVDWRLSIRMGR